MTNMQDRKEMEQDPLLAEVARAKEIDPAPVLSGTAKTTIVQAARENAAIKEALLSRLATSLGDGLDMLLRPVAYGTLAVAAVAGLFAGSLVAGAGPAYATLEPEEELAAYYQDTSMFGDIYAADAASEGQ